MRPVAAAAAAAGEEGEELQVQCRLAAARARRPQDSCLTGLSLDLMRGASATQFTLVLTQESGCLR